VATKVGPASHAFYFPSSGGDRSSHLMAWLGITTERGSDSRTAVVEARTGVPDERLVLLGVVVAIGPCSTSRQHCSRKNGKSRTATSFDQINYVPLLS
jgi:hypothetical protein